MKKIPKATEHERLVEAIHHYLPSQKELCGLAATLAGGQPFDRVEANDIAKRAIFLWDACDQIIRDTVAERAKGIAECRARAAAMPKVRVPSKYPVAFNTFLRLAGGKREDERLPLYRLHLKETGVRDVTAVLARQRLEGFGNEFDYYLAASEFLTWLEKHRSSNRKLRASKGGEARRDKRAAEKLKAAKKNA